MADDVPPADAVRPVVGVGRAIPSWLLGVAIVLLALILFAVLETRREKRLAPSVPGQVVGQDMGTAAVGTTIPPLVIPPAPAPAPAPARVMGPAARTVTPFFAPPVRVGQPPIAFAPPVNLPPPPTRPPASAGSPGGGDTVLVYDGTVGEATAAAPVAGNGGAAPQAATSPAAAARATLMRNVSTTVPEGTLIPATLETALDSTRPGLARAVVARDVVGFDGTRVLIPRGSRLIGDYRADVQPGQKRLLVSWSRLVRPDGATIAIGSPSADPLGRIGIAGSVNSHFFERFAGAILQSALNVGVAVAARGAGTNSIILGTPLSVQNGVGQLGIGTQVQPTLRVKPGVAIGVFVARDLDFTAVERRR